jgi:glycosyltransferase involved in cell wall biosynthesis
MYSFLARSETFIYTLIKNQREFRPAVLAWKTENLDEFPLEPVYTLRVPTLRARGPLSRRVSSVLRDLSGSYERKLASAVDESRCVVLHAHFAWSAYPNLRGARRLGLPLVTSFYGRDIPDARNSYTERLFRQGARFICEGPVAAERLRSVGCPAGRIRLVRIGIELDQFPFQPRERGTSLVILQTARFMEKKGVDLSIRAFAEARTSLPPGSELWLVGDGVLRAELEALAAELGVSDGVKFLGMLSHVEYRALTARVTVAIQPSRVASDGDTEGGAPTVILEMQAAGIPVVATRHADIPFIVPDPERLVAEEDVAGLAAALVEVASLSASRYSERVGEARAFVETRHDARVVAPLIAAVYREALEGGPDAVEDPST